MAHTAGPWNVFREGESRYIVTGPFGVALTGLIESRDDANLMAAAVDLLEFARRVVDRLWNDPIEGERQLAAEGLAVIALAEGCPCLTDADPAYQCPHMQAVRP